MIRRLLRAYRARKASNYLRQCRTRREREAIRATARQLCVEMGRPIPKALRG